MEPVALVELVLPEVDMVVLVVVRVENGAARVLPEQVVDILVVLVVLVAEQAVAVDPITMAAAPQLRLVQDQAMDW